MPRNSNSKQWDNLNEIPGFTKSNHCKVCKKHVKNTRYHLRHTISFHLSEATQENIDIKYPCCCDECDYRCAQPVLLETHIRVWHTGEKPYICPHGCGAFADHGGFSHHMKRKHNRDTKKREVCEVEYQDDDEDDEQAQSEAPSTAQQDTVHGGPSRATRATRRFVPYTAPKKAKATKKARAQDSPRSISPTYDAQPVQQKGVYYEAKPSPYQCHSSLATLDLPPVLPPAPTYTSPAPVYSPPTPSYSTPAPIYHPAAYSSDCNATYYGNYHASAAPNTTYASSSSFDQPSSSVDQTSLDLNHIPASSNSFYSTTSSDSLYIAVDSTIPQLTASDIKFAGFSSSAVEQTPAYDAYYGAGTPAFATARVDAVATAEANAFPTIQPYELPTPQVDAFSPAELANDASWYWTEESSTHDASSSPFNASSSPYNTSSSLDNLTFDTSPSETTWVDYEIIASPVTPVDFGFAQQSFDNLSQESWQSCSQESWLNCSQASLLDLDSIDFADTKTGYLDLTFGDSFPASDAPCNKFPWPAVQYNPEEIARLLNELVYTGAMA
ncbi:uncharacterized protein SCHCODRAFT_02698168 [Schizophyllum commune H4-8]|uniref:C2H2-type domain-containing protein n=1 Tax=Schizophyllum commune (strain H4-8 / FGSC 9210) TaxID=578458 RepID=D8PX89_SCHCM|nr:uncharacterized protein SCHCODRAFT_02698168 [Schizophyllum commune H4-8]KAI5896819.1 hypothetical protein SCHCODRAFT_02698168 [Schizophyllum commune H4-8]